jgi:hypothetical protein
MKSIFIVLVTLFFSTQLIAEDKEHDIDGYTTYEDAYNALKGNPQAQFLTKNGWTIVNIEEANDFTVWSFTPETHAAHPAVVKRKMVKKDDVIYIDMKGICDADKPECDKLFTKFEEMNNNITEKMQSGTAVHE